MHNFLQFDFTLNPKDALKFVVMADGSNFQIPKTSVDDQLRPNVDANQRTRAQSAVLTWSHAFSANSWLASSLYERWSRTRLFPASDPLASFAQNDRKLLTTGFKSDFTQFRGRHTIKSGVDLVLLRPDENLYFYGEGYVAFSHLAGLHHVHLRGPDRGPITFADQQTGGQISAYVQDSLQLARKLTLDAGVRYDGYSLATSATHFSPRLNLAYRLSDAGTIIHASYNHFFVPPAIENVLISSAGLTRFLQDHPEPLPPLQPIVENQVELGITQPIHDVLRAGVSAYYRLSNNPVHTVLFPDSRIYAYANFDKGKAYGMEIKLDSPALARFGVRSYLNYALSRTYFWNPVTAGFVDEAHHLEDTERFLAPMDQTHTLNAGITYHHRRSGLWGGMTFRIWQRHSDGSRKRDGHRGAGAAASSRAFHSESNDGSGSFSEPRSIVDQPAVQHRESHEQRL
jgi:outer membrane receptor protein involved in Fe transport